MSDNRHEFLLAAASEGWTVASLPDHDHRYGRVEVKRREYGRMVYVAIETDTYGRIISAGISYGRDRTGARSAHSQSRQRALAWLQGQDR